MKLGSLFTGYGGLDMAAAEHFGAETVWCSDIDPGACKIIAHRFPGVPNLGDITAIDWASVEPVDILTGGFPCQDVSHAGNRAGLRPDTRTGLWSQMAYAVSRLRPRYVVAENVRGLLSAEAHSDVEPCPWCVGDLARGGKPLRALGAVLGDLAELGYDARWHGVQAADVGAPHGRFRVFILATDTQHAELEGVGALPRLGCRPDPRTGVRLQTDPTADADSERHGRREDARMMGPLDCGEEGTARQRERARGVAGDRGATAVADAPCSAWRGTQPEHLGTLARPTAEPRERAGEIAWGDYEPAIRRWERSLGRPAPAPTKPGPKGGQRLSPRFVEWMMGLLAGWVTDVPDLSRNAQLKALGNGVVPQQALAALRLLDQMRAAA